MYYVKQTKQLLASAKTAKAPEHYHAKIAATKHASGKIL